MSQIKLKHSGGNSVIIAAPDSNPASDRTLKLPSNADGTVLTTTNPKSGNILQVKQAVKTDTSSSTSATYADISGLSVAITPTSTSNKILVTCVVQFGGAENSYIPFKALRGSTLLAPNTQGTGNMSNVSFGGFVNTGSGEYSLNSAVWKFLDSPSSTSALTYKIQFASAHNSHVVYINRPQSTDNEAYIIYGSSTITVQEVAA